MCLYNQERPIELICAECLKEPPAFTQVICPFIYHAPVSHWLHRFKYQGNVSDGKLLVRVLCASIEASPTPFPNYLVSVPMHWSKRLSRGFNQTDWLTRQLSQNFKIPIINVLQRNAGYTTQSHSNRRTRKNIKGAYQLRPTMIRTIKQQHLALVDDVVTTGATSRFISQLLIDAGAEKIDIWCLARTAKEHGK
jgi:ComF family protein